MDLCVLCWWGKGRVGAELRVQSLEFRFGMPAAWAYFFIVRCREVGTNLPFACRGEHCSPVAFTRWVSLTGWLHGRHSSRAYKPTRYIRYNIRSRAGLAPPLRGGGFVYSNIGRGDPTEKAFPLGGKVARNAPDEGDISGSCNTNQPVVLQPPQNCPERS